jgi:hypothetical protein
VSIARFIAVNDEQGLYNLLRESCGLSQAEAADFVQVWASADFRFSVLRAKEYIADWRDDPL